MNKLAGIIEAIGKDVDTLEHLRWIFDQDKSLMQDLLTNSQESTLEEALVIIGKKEIFWNNPAFIMKCLLNDAAQKIFRMNYQTEVNFSNISIQYFGAKHCKIGAHVEVFIGGESVYIRNYVEIDVTEYADKNINTAEEILNRVVATLTEYITTDTYHANDEPLEMALTFESVMKDLHSVARVYEALRMPLSNKPIQSIYIFMREYLTNLDSSFGLSFKQLCNVYQKVVSTDKYFLFGEDFICCVMKPKSNRWSTFLESEPGVYMLIHKDHERYAAIQELAEERFDAGMRKPDMSAQAFLSLFKAGLQAP